MEFIARIFVETAATMILLACVNSTNISSVDLSGFNTSMDFISDEAPAIPATYYMDYDSELQRF